MFSQPGSPFAISRAIRRRSSRLPIARSVPARAALLRPARQDAREQRAARAVGVLVERDVDLGRGARRAARAAARSGSRRRATSGARDGAAPRSGGRRRSSRRPPRAARCPRSGRAARAARRGGRLLGDGDELVGGRVGARQVDEPEREHPRACLEAEADLAPHRRAGSPRSARPARRRARLAHGAVADRGHERERGPRRVERVEVLLDRRPRPLSGPPPSSGRRYAWRSARRAGSTGAGARPSGLITSVVKPCASFGVR